MARLRHGRLGAMHFRQQLHLLQLLRRPQNPHEPQPTRAQQPLRCQRRRQSLRPPRRPRLRQASHLAHPPHRLRRGPRRLRRPVARRQRKNQTPLLLAGKVTRKIPLGPSSNT